MTVVLGDVVEVVMGQAPPGDACNKVGDGVPFVKAGEFADRRPVIREWTTKPLRMAQEDDTLVCVVGATAGKVNQGADCAIGRSVAAVRPCPQRIDSNFLYRFLSTTVSRLRSGSQGAAQGVITRAMICSLALDLPPLDEQRRIAAILDQADALRVKRRQALTHLDQLPLAIFLDMFGSPDDAVDRVPFGEVARLSGGRNLVADDAQLQAPYRVLKISAVTTGYFKPHESKPLPADYVPPESHLVRRGDLLMSRANTTELVGAVALVHDAPENLALPDKVWKFDWRVTDSVPAFYHALFRTPSVRRQVSRLSSGTGGSMKNVAKGKLETMLIPDVPPAQQRAFAMRVDCVSSQRAATHRAILAEEELFASLQFRAFRGEL